MPVACAKGTLLVGAVVSARRHRDAGRVSADQLERKLGPDALAMIDERIDIARWYPVEAFCELLELDWEIAGHRHPGYLERQGALTADRLFDSGLYMQLDFAKRSGKVETLKSLERQAKLITTITATLYNFLSAEVRTDGDVLQIEYGDAEPFRESLAHTTVGFMNEINLKQGSKRSWSFRRTTPDRVVFTLSIPDRLSE